jgi:hypothetical protein
LTLPSPPPPPILNYLSFPVFKCLVAALIVTLAKVQEPLGEEPADPKFSFSIRFASFSFLSASIFCRWIARIFV